MSLALHVQDKRFVVEIKILPLDIGKGNNFKFNITDTPEA